MVDLFTGVVIFAAMSAATTAVFATIYSKLRGERFVRDWFLLVVLVAVGLFGTTLQSFPSCEWVVVLANASYAAAFAFLFTGTQSIVGASRPSNWIIGAGPFLSILASVAGLVVGDFRLRLLGIAAICGVEALGAGLLMVGKRPSGISRLQRTAFSVISALVGLGWLARGVNAALTSRTQLFQPGDPDGLITAILGLLVLGLYFTLIVIIFGHLSRRLVETQRSMDSQERLSILRAIFASISAGLDPPLQRAQEAVSLVGQRRVFKASPSSGEIELIGLTERSLFTLRERLRRYRDVMEVGDLDRWQEVELVDQLTAAVDLASRIQEVGRLSVRVDQRQRLVVVTRPAQLVQAVVVLLDKATALATAPDNRVELRLRRSGTRVEIRLDGVNWPGIAERNIGPAEIAGRIADMKEWVALQSVWASVRDDLRGSLYFERSEDRRTLVVSLPAPDAENESSGRSANSRHPRRRGLPEGPTFPPVRRPG